MPIIIIKNIGNIVYIIIYALILGFWATLITIVILDKMQYFWLMFAVFGASFGLIMLLHSNDKKNSKIK